MKKRHAIGAALVAVVIAVGVSMVARAQQDWRTASREPVGLAPDPATTTEAVLQVYGARTVGARGVFAVHTWVAVKRPRALAYTVYEVLSWKLDADGSSIAVRARTPDARWYGTEPELYADVRGARAELLISRVEAAVGNYPFAREYRVWPGPNSNTFTAWITRQVPELRVDLPPTAIGKDYLPGAAVSAAPSGHGVQLSLAGFVGLTASSVEGLEVNLLGLAFGVDPWPPALKLPLAGRIGASAGPS